MTNLNFSPMVTGQIKGDILLVTLNNPPVNLLSHGVREGLVAALNMLEAYPALKAAVIHAEGKAFCLGADISEFGAPIAPPQLPEVIAKLKASTKPVVVALQGRAFGGGFELALAASHRIACPAASLSLPEIKLGLLPGAGGIDGVTRLAGVEVALDLCLSGRAVPATEALSLGLLDAVVEGDLIQAALALAATAPSRAVPKQDAQAATKIADFFAKSGRKLHGQEAPRVIAGLIEAAATTEDDLSARTAEAFFALEAGAQSRALRHIRHAERQVAILPDVSGQPLPVRALGVVGAGTMGSGIATAFLAAGFGVTIVDSNAPALARAQDLIAGNLAGAVKRGKMSEAAREAALAQLSLAQDLAALSAADVVIEAVYENMDVKKSVLTQLDQICKPEAIIASNTSFLDIDALAAVTSRPERVLGLHFFSPAHVMRLLEVVRGAKTAPEVLITAMDLGQKIGKIAVCVGNCHGFVGNRILLPRQEAAMALLLGGISPYRIDQAMQNFGIPMGPFWMADLAGLDVGWDREGSAGRTMEEVFCEAGRLGMKNGLGWYDYDEKGRPQPSAAAQALIAEHAPRIAKAKGIAPLGEMSEAEILDALLAPMLSEVEAIIAEGIVIRPSDIDVIWVHGYGWPSHRGGPAWYLSESKA